MKKEKPMKKVFIQSVDFDGINFDDIRKWLKKIETECPQYKELVIDTDWEHDCNGNRNNTLEVYGVREKTAEEIKAEKKAFKEEEWQRFEMEKKTYEALKKKFEKADKERQVKRKKYFEEIK